MAYLKIEDAIVKSATKGKEYTDKMVEDKIHANPVSDTTVVKTSVDVIIEKIDAEGQRIIDSLPDDYSETIERIDNIETTMVKTVNGTSPDENGNVEVQGGGSGKDTDVVISVTNNGGSLVATYVDTQAEVTVSSLTANINDKKIVNAFYNDMAFHYTSTVEGAYIFTTITANDPGSYGIYSGSSLRFIPNGDTFRIIFVGGYGLQVINNMTDDIDDSEFVSHSKYPTTNAMAQYVNIHGGGSGISDVKINNTSVVKDGVAKIPYASSNTHGVMAVMSQKGLLMSDGYVGVNVANWESVDRRNQAIEPILLPVDYIDYAVKCALTDGKGQAWTSTEKSAAKTRLGISSSDISIASESDIANRSDGANAIIAAYIDYAVKCALTDGKGAEWTATEKSAARSRLGISNVHDEIILKSRNGNFYSLTVDDDGRLITTIKD